MTAKQTRWKCPNDKHPGILGPTKPRNDNTVRYCLPCSQETGKLVKRISPVMQKRAEIARERAQTKAKRKAQRAKDRHVAYYTAEGVNLKLELDRIWHLKAVMGRRQVPTLIVRRSKKGYGRLGLANLWANEITILVKPGYDWADLLDTLVHEIAHMKAGENPDDHAKWHGKEWKHAFREVAVAAYNVDHGMVQNAYIGQLAQKLRDTYDSPEMARRRERRR